jgi:integrase
MGRTVNEKAITTRAARNKLKPRKAPYWRAIDRGAHLGYRKGKDGGSWVARFRRPDRTYETEVIGKADDAMDADGIDVLDFSAAQTKARTWCEDRAAGRQVVTYTVGHALDDYLASYARRGKGENEVKRRVERDIRPEFGETVAAELTTQAIRKWHEKISATAPGRRKAKHSQAKPVKLADDPDVRRRRQATANRTLTILKAALNHAFHDGHVQSDEAWRRVKPFKNVDVPRVRYISTDEATRLINACDPDFRNLARAALFTGCRYGELIAAEVCDFNPDNGALLIRFTKNGRPRHVPITEGGIRFFERLTAGRKGSERLFLREDGQPWGKSHQRRRLLEASKRAKIEPAVTFHILRHSYGSWLAMRDVSMGAIANALGHADTRITERHYAHLSPDYVADTVRANLPALDIEDDETVVVMKPQKV